MLGLGCVSELGRASATEASFVFLIVKLTFPDASVFPATSKPYPVALSFDAFTEFPSTSHFALEPLYGAFTMKSMSLFGKGEVPSEVTK